MPRTLVTAAVGLLCVAGVSAADDGASSAESVAGLHKARRTGWQMVQLVVDKFDSGNVAKFPGTDAWMKDFRKATHGIELKVSPAKWPALEIDALVSRNPNWWRAYYEIAPGDPGLLLLHAGLLLSAGEATRATHLIIVAHQIPRCPQEFKEAFDVVLNNAQAAHKASNELVFAGNKLFDQRDFAAALKKHKEALEIWPQNGFAHYEVGLTLRELERAAAGKQPLEPDRIFINPVEENSKDVDAAFAKSRLHDPFQIRAYQGKDKDVINGFLALSKKGLPAWQKLVKNRKAAMDDEVLREFASACQDAGIHELALSIRQVLVAHRRGRYASEDHPFIMRSLKQLAPGKATEATLERLKSDKLELQQLVSPQ